MKLSSVILAAAVSCSALLAQCPSGTSYGGGDDVVVNAGAGIPLGFNFLLGGVVYTHIHPSTNGFLYLSDGTPTLTLSDLSPDVADMAALEPRIAPLWDDQNLSAANNGELWVDNSSGTECKVIWANAVNFGQTNVFSFGVTITAAGTVDFVYDANVANASGPTIVGVSPGNGIVASTSVDISGGIPSASDMAFEEFLNGGDFDLQDSLTIFAPTIPGFVPAYIPSGQDQCATSEVYGAGCGSVEKVHELFPQGPMDITNAVTFLRDTSGYTILDQIPGVYVPPTASAVTTVTVDDGFATVQLSQPMPTATGTTSDLSIHSNGFVVLSAAQPAIAASWTPTIEKFEAFADPTICGPWYDYSPNVNGSVLFEEVGGIAYVTYEGVTPYTVGGTTTPDTFQYQFDLATGNCTIVYESVTQDGTSTWHTPLFGYTNGLGSGGASQPRDMTVDLPATIRVEDVGAGALTLGGTVPKVGGVFDIVTTNIDPISPISILMFSDLRANPSVLLPAVGLDAPGCSIYLNSILGTITATNSGGTSTVSWTLPPNAGSFLGATVATQSVCLTTSNSLNLLTSNGFEGVIGL